MSKIGEKPIKIAEGVNVTLEGKTISFIGPLGELKLVIPEGIEAKLLDREIRLMRLSDIKQNKALHGTYARLITNSINGVLGGFTKVLEVVGTGYRAEIQGEELLLSLGFSHPIKFNPPSGINLQVKENKIVVFGMDKGLVGLTADQIKRFRPPDPYKGKGIRYQGEYLRLKPGKAAAKTTTK